MSKSSHELKVIVDGETVFSRELGIDVKVNVEAKEPEKVFLYCGESVGKWITAGKVYESINGWIRADDDELYVAYSTVWKGHLYPLVKRPAKTGDVILVADSDGRVSNVNGRPWLVVHSGYEKTVFNNGYMVIDGYRPEPKPQGWNGKVFCAKSSSFDFDAGYVYDVLDGRLFDKHGIVSSTKCESVDEIIKYIEIASCDRVEFIEYKGEVKSV